MGVRIDQTLSQCQIEQHQGSHQLGLPFRRQLDGLPFGKVRTVPRQEIDQAAAHSATMSQLAGVTLANQLRKVNRRGNLGLQVHQANGACANEGSDTLLCYHPLGLDRAQLADLVQQEQMSLGRQVEGREVGLDPIQ